MSKVARGNTLKLTRYLSIGAADAIDDRQYLSSCFVDNGSLEILADLQDPRCVALGRTGAGKTALLEGIQNNEERTIRLEPGGLAVSYLTNNEVIRFFTELGVNMDLFYRLLWRHVFVVEIIKSHFKIVNEQSRESFIKRIWDMMSVGRSKKEALDYVLKWGRNFWEATDYRVKEVTQNLERDLKEGLSASVKEKITGSGFDLGHSSSEKLTIEEKADVVKRGQDVVNSVQIQRMSEVINLLDQDILIDEQKVYYIPIDKLDEDWVEDKLRYQMLQALLETVRDINNRIRHVKIIIALRDDLVVRVFRMTRNPGYQSEKYKALYLNLTWSRDELERVLDLRIGAMIRRQFTSQPLSLKEILPESTSKSDYVKYFLDRTLMRPRDAIMFFNECIRQSEGKKRVTKEALVNAETIYSSNRLDALSDEWASDYPQLRSYAMVLQRLPKNFRVFEVKEKIEERCIALFSEARMGAVDLLNEVALHKYANNEYDVAFDLISVLFKTGLIGLRKFSNQNVKWSFLGEEFPISDINSETYVEIHPAFYRVLGI